MNVSGIRNAFYVCVVAALILALGREFYEWPVAAGLRFLALVAGVLALILMFNSLSEDGEIKLGTEVLPPKKDIASVVVKGAALPNHVKNKVIAALARSKRAQSTYPVVKELPFQVVDRYGGIWDFTAYQDKKGVLGFSINRVYYAGQYAERVAKYVGVESLGMALLPI